MRSRCDGWNSPSAVDFVVDEGELLTSAVRSSSTVLERKASSVFSAAIASAFETSAGVAGVAEVMAISSASDDDAADAKIGGVAEVGEGVRGSGDI